MGRVLARQWIWASTTLYRQLRPANICQTDRVALRTTGTAPRRWIATQLTIQPVLFAPPRPTRVPCRTP